MLDKWERCGIECGIGNVTFVCHLKKEHRGDHKAKGLQHFLRKVNWAFSWTQDQSGLKAESENETGKE